MRKTANENNLEIMVRNINLYMPYLTKILKSRLTLKIKNGRTVYNEETGKFISHIYIIEHWNKDVSKLYEEIFTGTDKECLIFLKQYFDIEKLKEAIR